MTGSAAPADVLVLGAGLVGAAVARELAERGRRVALLGTPEDALSPGLGHVLVGPGMAYRTAIDRLGRERARQVWEGQRENGDRVRLFADGVPGACDYRRAGGFLLAADRAEGMRLADSEDLLREDGFPGEFLDHYMLEARFDVKGFAAAYWAADDAELDPARLLAALLGSGAALGVRLVPAGPPVTLQVLEGSVVARGPAGETRAPWAVVTAENASASLGAPLAPRIEPTVVHGVTVRIAPGAVVPSPAWTADGETAWQLRDGQLLLAARDGASSDLPALADRLAGLPGLMAARQGLVGSSADGLPVIGLLPDRPVAVAMGVGMLAPSYAFMAARWIAEAIVSGRDPTPAVFRPGR